MLFCHGWVKTGNKTSASIKKNLEKKKRSIYLSGIVEAFGAWMEGEVVYGGYLGLPPAIAGWPADLHHVVTEAMTKRHAVRIIGLWLWGGSQLYLKIWKLVNIVDIKSKVKETRVEKTNWRGSTKSIQSKEHHYRVIFLYKTGLIDCTIPKTKMLIFSQFLDKQFQIQSCQLTRKS